MPASPAGPILQLLRIDPEQAGREKHLRPTMQAKSRLYSAGFSHPQELTPLFRFFSALSNLQAHAETALSQKLSIFSGLPQNKSGAQVNLQCEVAAIGLTRGQSRYSF